MSLKSECLVRQCLHRLPPTCRADCSAHGVHQLGRPSLADPRFHAGAPACPCPPLSAYGTGGLFAGRSPGGSNGQKSLGTANEQGSRRTQRHGRPARRAPRCAHGGAVWPRASSAGARMIHGCDATGDRARRHRPACRPASPSVRADGGRPVPHGVCAGQQDGSTRGPVARQQGQVTHSLLGVHISSCTLGNSADAGICPQHHQRPAAAWVPAGRCCRPWRGCGHAPLAPPVAGQAVR